MWTLTTQMALVAVVVCVASTVALLLRSRRRLYTRFAFFASSIAAYYVTALVTAIVEGPQWDASVGHRVGSPPRSDRTLAFVYRRESPNQVLCHSDAPAILHQNVDHLLGESRESMLPVHGHCFQEQLLVLSVADWRPAPVASASSVRNYTNLAC